MFRFGKTVQHALAVMSYLAEVYVKDEGYSSSQEIAKARGLPRPVVAKTLNSLTQSELIHGTPGPNGGYRLGRKPAEISFFDVVTVFEPSEKRECPFKGAWGPHTKTCPLHDKFAELVKQQDEFLMKWRFDVFSRSELAGP